MLDPVAKPLRLRNWARNESSSPHRCATPPDVEALRELLRDAAAEGRSVKVGGALHSWSAAAMTSGVSVSLDRISSLREIDRTRGEATVDGGMRLHEINAALDAEGLALPILGSIAQQSVAGAIATGTHGSSLHHGNLASGVTGLEILDAAGQRRWLDRDDPLLDAARVGLGALGIVTGVRLKVCPAFRLRETLTRLPFEAGLEQLEELAREASYLKIWWLPPHDELLAFRYEPTDAPSTLGRVGPWFDEKLVNPHVFRALLWAGGKVPALVPSINRVVHRLRFAPAERVGPSAAMFTLAMPPRHRECEFALPLARASEALRTMHAIVKREGLRLNFIQELRFVRGDAGWMSPAYGGDTAQLGAYMAASPELETYFGQFEAAMRELGGRPHWGKEFRSFDAHEVRRCWPKAREFTEMVHAWDPEGRFENPFLRRILGPREGG